MTHPSTIRPHLVVMAAGIGSRYGGLKQIDPVGPGGENVLDYSVFDAARAGFGKVVFVIRRDIETLFREKVGRTIEPHIDCAYVFQDLDNLPGGHHPPRGRTKPWGTTQAALCARPEVDGPFTVINADDFYGAEAFAVTAAQLTASARARAQGEYCMVGYRLDHTLSEHGHVSRGVCAVGADGFLEKIEERTRIQRFDDGIKFAREDGPWVALPGDTIVSMNLWGFTREFFDHLESHFGAFLAEDGDSVAAECYLPSVVHQLIGSGEACVRVLRTDARWFGITYPEDKEFVRRGIGRLIAAGEYPQRLWA